MQTLENWHFLINTWLSVADKQPYLRVKKTSTRRALKQKIKRARITCCSFIFREHPVLGMLITSYPTSGVTHVQRSYLLSLLFLLVMYLALVRLKELRLYDIHAIDEKLLLDPGAIIYILIVTFLSMNLLITLFRYLKDNKYECSRPKIIMRRGVTF